jgi:hypothetical protein
MMKIIVGIAALAVLGGGAYLVMQKKVVSTSTEVERVTNSEAPAAAGAFSGSITDLSKRGGSWKCSVDTSTAQAASSGTVYVSGAKVRADFAINAQGYGTMNAYMIADGEYTYSWSSVMPQGMKAKMTAEGESDAATSGQGMDAHHNYSYDCEAWIPDESVFVVPTEITFTTI